MKNPRALLVALPLLVLVMLFTMGAMSHKTPTDLGIRTGRLRECGDRPNCVSSQSRSDDSRVAPLSFADQSTMAWDRVRAAVSSMRGSNIVADEDGYMHVEFRSRIFRFVDDLELLLDEANNRIDIRSASRIGYSDLGVNRKRVEQLRVKFSDMASEAVK